ncbi:MAG: ribulose-phosphate 3-epimerase [Candidatus Babeliales bacterium]
MKIYPSLISADLLNLHTVIKNLEPHCDGFHLDIMDNHFVPNLTWGPMFIKAIAHATTKPVFVHLMIENAEKFLEKIEIKRASTVSFHIENTKNISEAIQRIRENKWHANIAIKPNTPLEKLFPYLGMIDSVLLMSVDPGFSGQRFLESSWERLKKLAAYRKEEKMNFMICMDGGINSTNIAELARNGCDEVGVAAAIFSTPDPVAALKELYNAAR